jgi:lipopolysaccharide transport system permease protein
VNVPLLLHFARQDLLDRYASSILGGLWTFIFPLVNILIFIFVFSKIMGARLASFGVEFSEYGYSIYLVTGMLAWSSFSLTLSRVTNVFIDKAALIGKVNISLRTLPLYILISEGVIYAVSMLLFAIFLLLIDFPFTWHWLLVPAIYVVQQLLAYAIGFFCAVISVFVRDVREFVTVLVQVWFWLTPIVYVVTILPESYQALLMLNPVYLLIESYRDAILLHQLPAAMPIVVIATLAAILLGTALFGLRKLERDIRDFL